MTTTLTITSGQTSFTAQGWTILPSPGTAVPDNLAQAILSAANTAGVVLSSSAGTGVITVPSRRFNRSGVGPPVSGEGFWLLGDEIVDSAGAEYECSAPGNPGTWTTAQSGTFVSRSSASPTWKNAQMLAPTKAPVLSIGRVFPNSRQSGTIVWAQGNTAYAVGEDNSVRKSTDGGISFLRKNGASLPYKLGDRGCFLKTTAGTLLATENSTGTPIIRRSTDDGATWTAVKTFTTLTYTLSPQSWCQDANTGYLYYGEYQGADSMATIVVWRSTDDGVTWTAWYTFPGPTGGTLSTRVRHIHAVQYDSVSQRVYVCVGDVELSAGIYRVTADGTTLEAIWLNSQTGNSGNPIKATATPRCVSLMFFPNYIAWLSDDAWGNLCRIARTELGKANPVVSYMGFVAGSSGWASIRASADGSLWLVSTDSDQGQGRPVNTEIMDQASHLFAVKDDGATITEVGAQGSVANTSITAMVPVGQAELHADDLWLQTGLNAGGNTGLPAPMQVRANIAASTANLLPPPTRKAVPVPDSVGSGVITVAAGATVAFWEAKVPPILTRLFVFNGQKYHQSGTGTCLLEVIRTDNSAVIGSIGGGAFSSYWHDSGREGDEYWLQTTALPAGITIRFQLRETGGSAAEVCAGQVTYGFGLLG